MNRFEALVLVVIGLLIVVELLDSGFRRRLRRNDARLRRNLGYLVATILAMVGVRLITEFAQRHGLALVRWHGMVPLQIVCCFLVVELAGWLLHYVKHVNGFLWKFHFQHHREDQFDIWLSTHTHGLEVLVSSALIAATTSLLGFAPFVTELYVVVYTIVKVFQHSAHDYSLGILDGLIVGPAYHRLHHAVGSQCNYAVTLTLFDVVFGTATWPSRAAHTAPVPVGLDEEGAPFGFWGEMLYFLRRAPGARAAAGRRIALTEPRPPQLAVVPPFPREFPNWRLSGRSRILPGRH